ncbi:DUF2927 domain-containing protein [Algirhabdus cladophorae]|uniref:DUF2927 domain-containing protein n=1 Tax=Algirhabdus cladophorae TaxID=3377108 RepID=UPI003B846A19
MDPIPTPKARPTGLRPIPAKPERSAESFELERYYADIQQDLLIQGLLRKDGGGPDVRFGKRELVTNFVRIAMFDEFQPSGGQMMAKERENRLRRWNQPVRMNIEFGASVSKTIQFQDRQFIEAFANRLSRVTGLPIRQSSSNPNFHVLVLNENDRRTVGPTLRQLLPGVSDRSIRTIVNMPRSIQCLVVARSGSAQDLGTQTAIAVVRAEHPTLLRQSCYHEELAQGLGLTNDSDAARPSIFNDDDEFAYLTTHDELLLRILYDPRLRSGMTLKQVVPTVEVIAAEFFGGGT